MSSYNVLDTSAFDRFISQRSSVIQEYDRISRKYDSIVATLLENWKGWGAEAFDSDTKKIKTNIAGIQDILATVCDTCEDCREIFIECDSALGKANRTV